MEFWFIAAVAGMVLAGISNFGFKIAAKKNLDAETFTLYGGISSIVLVGAGLLIVAPDDVDTALLASITVFSGLLAASGNILKVKALRHIDTTIFYPLFKLLAPLLAVIFGLTFFGERFTVAEWIGIVLGLVIPLLLINKVENTRQSNLIMGLFFVILVSFTSSVTAALNKYAIDAGMSEWTTLWYLSWGVFIGSFVLTVVKLRTLPFRHILQHSDANTIKTAVFRSVLICLSLVLVFYAYGHGGSLGIVQTINSLYIIIPIVLSVLIYKEHINWNKAVAIVLSVVALMFLG